MNYYNSYSGGATWQYYTKTFLYGYVIPTSPSKTITQLWLPSDSDIQILAVDEIMQPPQVNLNSYYNEVGITTSGSSTPGVFNGGTSYSSTALGGNTVTWGTTTFNLGSANVNNAVSVSGQTISLTPGSYSGVQILAASINHLNGASAFTVYYADGSYSTVAVPFSDWRNGYTGVNSGAITNAPGETTVLNLSTVQYVFERDRERDHWK